MSIWRKGGQNAVLKDHKIIFYTGAHEFDIYDIPTGTWFIGVFPFPPGNASIISVNNTVCLGRELVNGGLPIKVWRLEF